MKEYHSIETLFNALLTPDLNTNIIRSLPIKLRISFNDKYTCWDEIADFASLKFVPIVDVTKIRPDCGRD